MGIRAVKLSHYASFLITCAFVAACSPPEEILPGERFGLRDVLPEDSSEDAVDAADAAPVVNSNTVAAAENQSVPISLPAQVNHANWTHRAGAPDHSVQHPALSRAPTLLWAANIGQGNDRKHRITADPVVSNGAIFTLDSRSTVTAVTVAGAVIWSTDLTPATDRADDASGGGLAVEGNRIFVTTGFGVLNALDTGSGALLWSQKLDAPASGAPSVVGGVVYVATKENRGFAVDAANGRIKWQLAGTPDSSGILGVSAPAVTDQLAIFPFSSGEMVAALRDDGTRAWNALVIGHRRGRGYSSITDITGEPVVVNGVIYAGNAVGRTIAMTEAGERLWTAKDGATGPVWVTGGSVFLISDEAKLVRLDATSGARIWAIDLPYFTTEKVRRRKAIYANFGPVLAGGNLWVASSDGVMRGFNPVDGSLTSSVEIPNGAATRPAIVNGVAYLVNTNGQLLALR